MTGTYTPTTFFLGIQFIGSLAPSPGEAGRTSLQQGNVGVSQTLGSPGSRARVLAQQCQLDQDVTESSDKGVKAISFRLVLQCLQTALVRFQTGKAGGLLEPSQSSKSGLISKQVKVTGKHCA